MSELKLKELSEHVEKKGIHSAGCIECDLHVFISIIMLQKLGVGFALGVFLGGILFGGLSWIPPIVGLILYMVVKFSVDWYVSRIME